jgi:hypothetical protein
MNQKEQALEAIKQLYKDPLSTAQLHVLDHVLAEAQNNILPEGKSDGSIGMELWFDLKGMLESFQTIQRLSYEMVFE